MTNRLEEYFIQEEYDIDAMTEDIQPKYFSGKLSYDELKEALTVFSKRSENAKLLLYLLLYEGAKELNTLAKEDCMNIIEKFNEVMTGNPQDMKGISTIITFFKRIEDFSDEARVFAQNGEPKTGIRFVYEGDEKEILTVSSAMKHFSSLIDVTSSYPGTNDFEKLLVYLQVTINSAALDEIYSFKLFLSDNEIFNEIPMIIPDYAKLLSVTNRKFIDESGNIIITLPEGNIKSTATIELSMSSDIDSQNVVYAIALYDRNTKKLIDFKSESSLVLRGQQQIIFETEPVLVKAPASDYLIKTFIWSGYNSMSPIGMVETLTVD
jgi:hypothetical protein